MEKVRLFIAIDLDKEGVDRITPFQKEIASKLKEVRWTKKDNWHITIKFLGEVESSQLDNIIPILEDIKTFFKPFTLKLDKIDVFPDIRVPRVIFLDVKDSLELKNLAEAIETKLSLIGFPKEKRDFRGHLTLGRIKDTKKFIKLNPNYKEILNRSLSHDFDVSEFYLYKSVLKKEGPEYIPLHSFPLLMTGL